ncbi:MAG: transcription elongation factor GreA [bacterium]|nr:transcription elongation factor GreA [bacterium]
MNKQFKLTKEGVAELEAELKELVSHRGDLAERIKTARDLGDLSENAEYSAAKDEQGQAETRIAEIENILRNGEVIKKPRGDAKVQLGSKVKLTAGSKTKEFQVVGTVEADPMEGKISDESPIGQALMGKKLGDEVEIHTPTETTKYKLAKID